MGAGEAGQRADTGILVRNARIFDGLSDEVRPGHVRIDGRKIAHVGADEPPSSTDSGHIVIDADGRTLIPGLSDAHAHVMLTGASPTTLLASGAGLSYLTGAAEAEAMLLRGFTTIRDMAGDTGDLKRLIDAGLLPGPRIYPSQAGISQTAGHGDFGMIYESPTALGGTPSRAEELGVMRVANGRPQVLAAVREQLKKGASQIKLMAGGGAASAYDPLDVLQFTADEMRAAVEAATDWGTYVTVHVYTGPGIRRAVEAGVAVIEHGQLADEDDIKRMADNGVWLSTQPFVENDHTYANPVSAEKNRRICTGVERTFAWALEHGVDIAFGTDLLLDPGKSGKQSEMLTRLASLCGSSLAGLKIATSGNAELFRLSGNRDPYQSPTAAESDGAARTPHHNHLGVIAEGAWADMLLIDGDPTRDLSLLGDPDTNLRLIIKDGRIHKNTL
ncbi:amidohydrolase family protein [Saccharomonospora sp.]|uniref:metal-dependent hydrolase family protein n=1 Tax=Saccharomonospora sp. TaxID=33913 RepID=UPI002604463E|nr:amidohydrolase family protein [Saccharomonospora sp.]